MLQLAQMGPLCQLPKSIKDALSGFIICKDNFSGTESTKTCSFLLTARDKVW